MPKTTSSGDNEPVADPFDLSSEDAERAKSAILSGGSVNLGGGKIVSSFDQFPDGHPLRDAGKNADPNAAPVDSADLMARIAELEKEVAAKNAALDARAEGGPSAS